MIRTYRGFTPKIHPRAFVHDSAEVIGRVRLGAEASVWPLCALRGDVERIEVGARTNIQDLTVIHTREGRPTVLGKGVTVGHRVILHGARVGDGCLIGMGAIVMEADIGSESLVAAGSLVLAGLRVPARSLVLGSPARVVRPLNDRELRRMRRGTSSYLAYSRLHARSSRVLFPA